MRLDLSHPKMLEAEERKALYRQVFLTPEGRLVLDDLAQASWFFHCTHPSNDLAEVMRMEGSKSLLLYICSLIEEPKPQLTIKETESKDLY